MNIYYAYFYKINSGFPKLLHDLSIKADSIDDAWREATKIAFDDTDQKNKIMLRMIELEDPF